LEKLKMNGEKQILFIVITASLCIFVISLLSVNFGVKSALLVAMLIPCVILSYKFPRWGLLAFLTYLPFGGTITYAIADSFKGAGTQITSFFHLAKDAFYFPALMGILVSSPTFGQLKPKIKPLLLTLSILLGVCLLTLLLVNLPQQLVAQGEKPFLMGLIGLKVLIGYIPLILCAYYFVRTRRDLYFLLRWLVILILICCSLCLMQYFLLVSGICPGSSSLLESDSLKPSLRARCWVGGSLLYNPAKGLIRLPGTFVSPWHWGWFLISSSFITYAASLSDPSRHWRLVARLGIAMVLVATFISGQRIAFLLVPISFLTLLLLTEKERKWLPLKLGSLVLLSLFTASQLDIVQQRVASFINRWNYSNPLDFMAWQFQWIFQQEIVPWLGYGLGRATDAARHFGVTSLIETFHVKLIYEIGFLGVLAFLGVVSTLSFLTFKAYRSQQDLSQHYLGICLWVFVLFISYNPYYYPLTVDPVGVYYWFLAGILLKLPELDRVC
jgi:hypothetical protein